MKTFPLCIFDASGNINEYIIYDETLDAVITTPIPPPRTKYLLVSGGEISGPLKFDPSGPLDYDPGSSRELVNRQQVDQRINKFLSDASEQLIPLAGGVEVTGEIHLPGIVDGNKLRAATKSYVQDAMNALLPLQGGKMTGHLTLHSTNLGEYEDTGFDLGETKCVPRLYVDSKISELQQKVETEQGKYRSTLLSGQITLDGDYPATGDTVVSKQWLEEYIDCVFETLKRERIPSIKLYQKIKQVEGFLYSAVFTVDCRIIHQRLCGGGSYGQHYPLSFRIGYRTKDSEASDEETGEHTVYYYIQNVYQRQCEILELEGEDNFETDAVQVYNLSQECKETFPYNHARVRPDVWTRLIVNLMKLYPKPKAIESIEITTAGCQTDAMVGNVSIEVTTSKSEHLIDKPTVGEIEVYQKIESTRNLELDKAFSAELLVDVFVEEQGLACPVSVILEYHTDGVGTTAKLQRNFSHTVPCINSDGTVVVPHMEWTRHTVDLMEFKPIQIESITVKSQGTKFDVRVANLHIRVCKFEGGKDAIPAVAGLPGVPPKPAIPATPGQPAVFGKSSIPGDCFISGKAFLSMVQDRTVLSNDPLLRTYYVDSIGVDPDAYTELVEGTKKEVQINSVIVTIKLEIQAYNTGVCPAILQIDNTGLGKGLTADDYSIMLTHGIYDENDPSAITSVYTDTFHPIPTGVQTLTVDITEESKNSPEIYIRVRTVGTSAVVLVHEVDVQADSDVSVVMPKYRVKYDPGGIDWLGTLDDATFPIPDLRTKFLISEGTVNYLAQSHGNATIEKDSSTFKLTKNINGNILPGYDWFDVRYWKHHPGVYGNILKMDEMNAPYDDFHEWNAQSKVLLSQNKPLPKPGLIHIIKNVNYPITKGENVDIALRVRIDEQEINNVCPLEITMTYDTATALNQTFTKFYTYSVPCTGSGDIEQIEKSKLVHSRLDVDVGTQITRVKDLEIIARGLDFDITVDDLSMHVGSGCRGVKGSSNFEVVFYVANNSYWNSEYNVNADPLMTQADAVRTALVNFFEDCKMQGARFAATIRTYNGGPGTQAVSLAESFYDYDQLQDIARSIQFTGNEPGDILQVYQDIYNGLTTDLAFQNGKHYLYVFLTNAGRLSPYSKKEAVSDNQYDAELRYVAKYLDALHNNAHTGSLRVVSALYSDLREGNFTSRVGDPIWNPAGMDRTKVVPDAFGVRMNSKEYSSWDSDSAINIAPAQIELQDRKHLCSRTGSEHLFEILGYISNGFNCSVVINDPFNSLTGWDIEQNIGSIDLLEGDGTSMLRMRYSSDRIDRSDEADIPYTPASFPTPGTPAFPGIPGIPGVPGTVGPGAEMVCPPLNIPISEQVGWEVTADVGDAEWYEDPDKGVALRLHYGGDHSSFILPKHELVKSGNLDGNHLDWKVERKEGLLNFPRSNLERTCSEGYTIPESMAMRLQPVSDCECEQTGIGDIDYSERIEDI